MDTLKICPNCRKPLPPDVPLGLCPECLIKAGFPTGTEPGAAAQAVAARFVPPPVAEIASLFPHLEIIRLIGQGGMGAVYKARQPSLDRFVALKVLPPAVAGDPGFAERFNREARALARLNHPNIVAVHDFGKAGPLHYLVMEFVDGTNLREVERSGELTREQALAIVPQICEALQFAHNEGIVHRDIKPENLLLDKKGRLKITDFGIAKMVGVSPGQQMLTGVKDVVGTPHYMAPEQIEKPQTVDHRADIYSLGVVFYEMLTGELPLGKFAPPSQKVQIDVRLDEVVLHALEKEPSRRYQQANQVKTDVEAIAGTSGPAIQPGTAPSPVPARDPAVSDKAILPAFLLAFFFGVFGAHRFYVGKVGSGLSQLGAFGAFILLIIACAQGGPQPVTGILLGFVIFGCVIWATVDWILIACKTFRDGEGKRLNFWVHSQNGHAAGPDKSANTPRPGPPPFGPAGPQPPPIKNQASSIARTGLIMAPAVGLMIVALWKFLSALMAMLFLKGWFSDQWMGAFKDFSIGPFSHWSTLAMSSILIFKAVPALLIFYGSFQMLRLRSYAWSLAAAILSIVACSLIGLPIGIWALVVLTREEVRETFGHAARSAPSKPAVWPWILGTTAAVIMLVLVGLALARHFIKSADVTISGMVIDAETGQPIVGARVDDNRYGVGPNKAPAQVWTDTHGHYQLSTWYEEHNIAASAPGYESKLSLLRTRPFGSEQNVRMNFSLEPQKSRPLPATAETNYVSPEQTAAPSTSTMASVQSRPTFPPVRIKAGSSEPIVDREGNLWLADQGFAGGDTVTRPQVAIVNTTDPELYRSERYGATSFSYRVPNGYYQVKLHFAETYEPVTGPDKRVFTFVVEGREFKNFDVWTEAGGAQRACVKTVNVAVTDGTLNIDFIPQRQNPEINAIEILPASPSIAAGAAKMSSTNGNSTSTNSSLPDAKVVTGPTNGEPLTGGVRIEPGGNRLPAATNRALDLKTPSAPPPPTEPADPPVTTSSKTPAAAKTAEALATLSIHQNKLVATLSTKDPFQQSFNRTLPLSANGRLRLDNVNGRMQIAGWDRNEVSIRALKHGKTREGVDAVKIKVNSSSNEVVIHTEIPSSDHGFSWSHFWAGDWGKDRATVDYAIQVPLGARLKSISSVNGHILIENVLGDIEASSVNGAMDIQNAAGNLKLSTVNGPMKAELDSLDAGQTVSLTTVNGNIEARLPANANAKVSASTVNGGLASEFPALVVKKEFPLGNNLKGALGNGSATVTASSVNGRINFRRGAVDPD